MPWLHIFLPAYLRNQRWIHTKFSWIYNWDITKNLLDFGDLDLIFKVTAVGKLIIYGGGGRGTSVFSENTIISH